MSRKRRVVRAAGAVALSLFALLLWSKLKLVSGIPRTALATPHVAPAQAGAAHPGRGAKGAEPAPERHAGVPAGDALLP